MLAAESLPSSVLLPLADIRLDGGTQSRAQLSEDTIADYSEKYIEGQAMPPVVVFYDGSTYWLADGFHRCAGAKSAGKAVIVAQVRQGSQRDAILFSVGANDSHGLRRTNADKRRAVEMLLRDAQWGAESDRWIGEKCAVDHKTVSRLRAELVATGEVPQLDQRLGQDGKVRKMPERATQSEDAFDPPSGTVEVTPRAERLHVAEPDPGQWWVCPGYGCGKEYNKESAHKFGWMRRGFCDDCPDPAPEDFEPCPDFPAEVAAPKSHPVSGTISLDSLQALAEQRNADPEFSQLRAAQLAVAKAMPSRAQRMLAFVLDGGELAMLRLGVDWSVTAETLQQAFREKSRTEHPDRGGTQEQFVALNQARGLVSSMLGSAF